MALTKITYTDKVALSPQPSVASVNKVTDADMNEIKSVVNDAIDQVDTNTDNLTNLSTYSTTEQVIGTWIDGKPLYKKIYEFTNLPSGNVSNSYPLGLTNIDTKMYQVYIKRNPSNPDLEGMYYTGSSDYVRAFVRGSSTLELRSNTQASYDLILILEYIKTTD